MSIFSKKCLGIDVGASSIKIVELSGFGKKKKLENYISFTLPFGKPSLKIFHGESLALSSEKASDILQAVLDKAEVKEKKLLSLYLTFLLFLLLFYFRQ